MLTKDPKGETKACLVLGGDGDIVVEPALLCEVVVEDPVFVTLDPPLVVAGVELECVFVGECAVGLVGVYLSANTK